MPLATIQYTYTAEPRELQIRLVIVANRQSLAILPKTESQEPDHNWSFALTTYWFSLYMPGSFYPSASSRVVNLVRFSAHLLLHSLRSTSSIGTNLRDSIYSTELPSKPTSSNADTRRKQRPCRSDMAQQQQLEGRDWNCNGHQGLDIHSGQSDDGG